MIKGIKTKNKMKMCFIYLVTWFLGGCIEAPDLEYAQPAQSFAQAEELIQTRLDAELPLNQMPDTNLELDLGINDMIDMVPNDSPNVRLITRSLFWSASPYTTRTPPRPRINGSFTWTSSSQE